MQIYPAGMASMAVTLATLLPLINAQHLNARYAGQGLSSFGSPSLNARDNLQDDDSLYARSPKVTASGVGKAIGGVAKGVVSAFIRRELGDELGDYHDALVARDLEDDDGVIPATLYTRDAKVTAAGVGKAVGGVAKGVISAFIRRELGEDAATYHDALALVARDFEEDDGVIPSTLYTRDAKVTAAGVGKAVGGVAKGVLSAFIRRELGDDQHESLVERDMENEAALNLYIRGLLEGDDLELYSN